MMKGCFTLCLKKVFEGNRRRGLAETSFLLTVCNLLKYVNFSNQFLNMPRTPIKAVIFPCEH